MGGSALDIGSYSPFTGFVFIFNLIVGAGALTIPRAFDQVGVFYGVIVLSVLAITSYITATFMVECIAGVNAITKRKIEIERGLPVLDEPWEDDEVKEDDDEDATHDSHPLISSENDGGKLDQLHVRRPELHWSFDLSQKLEMAEMAHILFNNRGIIAFYAIVAIYLYGDLAIYAVAVPKSLREMVCPRPFVVDLIDSEITGRVWHCPGGVDSFQMYRIFVVLFGGILAPFAFGQVSKTRTLQLITTIIRHTSFALMIILATSGIINGQGRPTSQVITYADPKHISTMFGVCIYSFMCHHSIPGLVAPITNKMKVGVVLASSFLVVYSVYLLLCFTATFRFTPQEIDDVYTLNFENHPVRIFAYYLSAFPVCTLSTNFPLIAITLRENLKTLAQHVLHNGDEMDFTSTSTQPSFIHYHKYALFAILPPLVIAFFTENVEMLVGFTGAYAGLGIQWVVPTCFVYSLRKMLSLEFMGEHSNPFRRKMRNSSSLTSKNMDTNPFASPFAGVGWIYLTLCLSIVSVVLITLSKGLV